MNPEFDTKDSAKNENASNVAVKPAELSDLHLAEKGFIPQNEIKENLPSATQNRTLIQNEPSQNLLASEKDVIPLNTENDEEDNPVSIASFQLALESIEPTSHNIHLTKKSLPIPGQGA